MLGQLGPDQPQRERSGIDRRVDGEHVAQQIGQPADVILVAVRDDDARDLVRVVAQIGEVRQDQVDAQHVELGEHDARVDHQDLVLDLEEHHVLADFAQPAERDDA